MDIFDKAPTPDPSTEQRLEAIERKLDAIIAHLGIGAPRDAVPVPAGEPALSPYDPRGMPAVVEWVQRGKNIQAIKAYRELTGAGLKEAKDAVDGLTAELKYRR